VIAKVRAGFTLIEARARATIGDDSPDDRIGALEARVIDDPTDAEAWMVYGDLLQRRGDPRGELVALQAAAEAERAANPRGRGAAQLAVTKYFAQHVAASRPAAAREASAIR
jgi:uncharacterized protein (TIGR02996 family)